MAGKKHVESAYRHWLYGIDGIGEITRKKLYEVFGSAEEVYRAPAKQVCALLNDRQQEAFGKARRGQAPEKAYEALARDGIRFVCRGDADYPQKLRDIPDPPAALYVKGKLPDETLPSVAVVGARFCSSYGRYMARQFGAELADTGIQVISGMALGVDGIAQTAALDAHGGSYAVLGSGVDVCYPPENRALYDRLCETGGVISEYVPGTQPKPGLFPQRNRIISGLADAVLVVEARKKSGTLITVTMALEQGKDVWALPGRATDRLSDGCNLLLKEGAGMATGAADIIESFFGVRSATEKDRGVCTTEREGESAHGDSICAGRHDSGKKKTVAEKQPRMTLSATEHALMEALDIHPKPAADILDDPALLKTGKPPQELLCTLTELALRGLIAQEGNCFVRRL